MVHALQSVRELLSPNGHLISVQDLPVPHVIEIQTGGKTTRAGWLFASDDFKIERAAYTTVTQVVSDGLFILDEEIDFDFRAYVDGLKEFQEWLARTWESSLIPAATLKRIEEITRNTEKPAKVILKSPARMTKLQAV